MTNNNSITFEESMAAYFSISKYPWKIQMLSLNFTLMILWTLLVYGIVYYINYGINELKRNILDQITIIIYYYGLGKKIIISIRKALYAYFNLGITLSCGWLDLSHYLFGPFPSWACYGIIYLKNIGCLGAEICLFILCYLK